jgi:putative amide transporter protein
LLARKLNIARITGFVTALEGVLTGWLPGYLLLNGLIGHADGATTAVAGGG